MQSTIDWAHHLENIAKEGISIASYARRCGISASGLYNYRWKLNAKRHQTRPTTPDITNPSSPQMSTMTKSSTQARTQPLFTRVITPPASAAPTLTRSKSHSHPLCCIILHSHIHIEFYQPPPIDWLIELQLATASEEPRHAP